MNVYIENYINQFRSFSKEMDNKIDETIEDWTPEEPPITIPFSELGWLLVQEFHQYDEVLKKRIFEHIEEGMLSINEELSTAVATGLIDAVVAATDNDDELWHKFLDQFGSESKAYALAWKNFGQEELV